MEVIQLNHSIQKKIEETVNKYTKCDFENLLECSRVFASSGLSHESFFDFQIQLITIFGEENTPFIMVYLKEDISLKVKNNNIKFSILERCKILVKHKISSMEKLISQPFKIINQGFMYSDEYPFHLISILTRGDGECFKYFLSFNDGIAQVTATIEHLIMKLDQGGNEINLPSINELESKLDSLLKKIEADRFKSND